MENFVFNHTLFQNQTVHKQDEHHSATSCCLHRFNFSYSFLFIYI